MDGLVREIFRYPDNVTRVNGVFYANGPVRFECYPEIGDYHCHDTKPRICREQCPLTRRRRDVDAEASQERQSSSSETSVERRMERQHRNWLRRLAAAERDRATRTSRSISAEFQDARAWTIACFVLIMIIAFLVSVLFWKFRD